MKAIVLDHFGAPEVLQWRDCPRPELPDGAVLLANAFASVNPLDCKTRAGLGWAAQRLQLPAVLGVDCAGIVVESRDPRFRSGMRVAALNFAGGCYAEEVAVAGDLLAEVPPEMGLDTAAALPCAGLTAWQIVAQLQPRAGEKLLLNAPCGGVGALVLQLLLARGVAVTVLASREKYAQLRTLPLAGWVDSATLSDLPTAGADTLIDLVGGTAGAQALLGVKKGGRALCVPTVALPAMEAAGLAAGVQVSGFLVQPKTEDLRALLAHVAAGKMTATIGLRLPLCEAARAHRHQEMGHACGKTILEVQS